MNPSDKKGMFLNIYRIDRAHDGNHWIIRIRSGGVSLPAPTREKGDATTRPNGSAQKSRTTPVERLFSIGIVMLGCLSFTLQREPVESWDRHVLKLMGWDRHVLKSMGWDRHGLRSTWVEIDTGWSWWAEIDMGWSRFHWDHYFESPSYNNDLPDITKNDVCGWH